jgi:Cu(I)/Ag(I) efflux system membrane fusion protein
MTTPSDPQAPPPGGAPHEELPEGDEAPPPGVRTMAVVRWALVALMALAAGSAWIYFARTGHEAVDRDEAKFICPMHPAVLSERPGSCPICGMDLVPIEGRGGEAARGPRSTKGTATSTAQATSAGAPAQGKYWCPMHPEVSSDDPNAICTKCGTMKLLPRPAPDAKAAAAPATAATPPSPPAGKAEGRYWCPMHPEVSSDDPNAICEKCGGMKLVPREQVAGLVPVDISSDRVQLIGMKTAPVTEQALAPSLRTVGIVTANEGAVVIVSSYTSGWIEELLVSQSGERVRKGQPLAKLYSPDLATAQLNYLNAIKWLRDQPNLNPPQNPSTIESDARTRLALLGITDGDIQEIEAQRKPLRAINIRAPIDGYVGKRTAQAGLFVSPGQELFEIADLSTVWVVADVSESEIARLRMGQKATITLQALPGQAFVGRVSFIYPVVNPATRTVQVRVEVKNPGLRLRPGLFADVVLDVGAVHGLVIPSEALVETGDAQYAFVAQPGGRFEPRKVTVGVRAGDRVQILHGLSAGERVVTTANFLIDSESRLRAAIQGFGGGAEATAAPAPAGTPAPGHEHGNAKPAEHGGAKHGEHGSAPAHEHGK